MWIHQRFKNRTGVPVYEGDTRLDTTLADNPDDSGSMNTQPGSIVSSNTLKPAEPSVDSDKSIKRKLPPEKPTLGEPSKQEQGSQDCIFKRGGICTTHNIQGKRWCSMTKKWGPLKSGGFGNVYRRQTNWTSNCPKTSSKQTQYIPQSSAISSDQNQGSDVEININSGGKNVKDRGTEMGG